MSYEDYRRARQRREGYARRYRTEDTNIFGEKSLLIAILRGMAESRQARARKAELAAATNAALADMNARAAAYQAQAAAQARAQAAAAQARAQAAAAQETRTAQLQASAAVIRRWAEQNHRTSE